MYVAKPFHANPWTESSNVSLVALDGVRSLRSHTAEAFGGLGFEMLVGPDVCGVNVGLLVLSSCRERFLGLGAPSPVCMLGNIHYCCRLQRGCTPPAPRPPAVFPQRINEKEMCSKPAR